MKDCIWPRDIYSSSQARSQPIMHPPLPRLADYDVSAVNGFLPTDPPCAQLINPYYLPWESVIRDLQPLLSTSRLRSTVDRLPVLSTDLLYGEPERRRAYSILGFIVHAYIWGGETPADIVPPGLSIPFLKLCRHLELPTVACYAGEVLWNWRLLSSSEPADSPENIFTLHTMTGSLDESWFFVISIAIEGKGGPLIPLMLDAISAARCSDIEAVTGALRILAERIDQLGILLTRMYEHCDPHIFYHRIRPYLAGSKNMAEAGLPNGVLFNTASRQDEYVQFAGGSNAQSSLIQFLDIVLAVKHEATEDERPEEARLNFILEMRNYMPGPHRRFLEHVERIANIRQFVVAHRDNVGLRTAYDACLAMLRTFRDIHIRMVARYIVVKSQESLWRPANRPARKKPLNLAIASSNTPMISLTKPGALDSSRKLKGTGGTALIPFLKQARDETEEPIIDAWIRALLSNGPGHIVKNIDSWIDNEMVTSPTHSVGRLTTSDKAATGERNILGLAGVWRIDDSEGGICHW